jgi:RNA polymerase sigma-70 factor (ECF subfamily)
MPTTSERENEANLAPADLERRLEEYRGELTGYCYRMLGASFEAEDAVQETLVRAWRSYDRFENRSSLRSWLYRIATNACLDMLNGRQRRARPMDLTPAATPSTTLVTRPENIWLEPVPDTLVLDSSDDPAELAVEKESIRLAFVAALQHLPPRQRAVLILREVLRWQASEVAELLETSVVSVNSALQRARATLAESDVAATEISAPMDEEQQALLARYVEAFEQYDIDSLVTLLHEDATMSMPPFELWLQGPQDVHAWFFGQGAGCRGSRLLPVSANGQPSFAHYHPDGAGGFRPWAIQVIEISDGRITAINCFLDTKLFALFGLPESLEH